MSRYLAQEGRPSYLPFYLNRQVGRQVAQVCKHLFMYLPYSFLFFLPFFLDGSIKAFEDTYMINWNLCSIFLRRAICDKGVQSLGQSRYHPQFKRCEENQSQNRYLQNTEVFALGSHQISRKCGNQLMVPTQKRTWQKYLPHKQII